MALGLEIRARRVALGLSQAAVARPMGRAFMSSVERGRYAPSLSSLLIIARQLNTSAATILEAVDMQLEARDNGNQDEDGPPTLRRIGRWPCGSVRGCEGRAQKLP